MKIKAFICQALQRSFYYYASMGEHVVDIEIIDVFYHEHPEKINVIIQEKINSIEKDKYDFIVLGYGLCGKVIDGIKSKDIPIVMPKVHDCTDMYLHKNKKYSEELKENLGCMYYINSLMELNGVKNVSKQLESIGMGKSYEELVETYGKENAEYLFEFVENISANYNTAVYIENRRTKKDFTKEILEISQENQWDFIKVEGDDSIIKDLVDLNLNSKDIIFIEPFTIVKYTDNKDLIKKEKY